MCADKECAISNTTPCVFVFRTSNSFSAPSNKSTSSSSNSKTQEKKDQNSIDKDWMIFLTEKKQRTLAEHCLHKKVMIQNTLVEAKKGELEKMT